MKTDPTKTITLRRVATGRVTARYGVLQRETRRLLVEGRAPSLMWASYDEVEKMEVLNEWFTQAANDYIIGNPGQYDALVRDAYMKGVQSAYSLVRKGKNGVGGRREFIESVMSSPTARKSMRLVALKIRQDLKGVIDALISQVSDQAIEWVVRGETNAQLYARITDRIRKIGVTRAKATLRSEIIRAHAEGQLDAYESLGISQLKLLAEWETADNPCPKCRKMDGVVLTIKEARGLIPRHPNCKCAWLPVIVQKTKKPGQITTKRGIQRAFNASIKAERPGRALSSARSRSGWAGAGLRVSNRPR